TGAFRTIDPVSERPVDLLGRLFRLDPAGSAPGLVSPPSGSMLLVFLRAKNQSPYETELHFSSFWHTPLLPVQAALARSLVEQPATHCNPTYPPHQLRFRPLRLESFWSRKSIAPG